MIILMTFMLLAFSDAPEQPDHPAVWKVARCEGRMGRGLFVPDPVLLKLAEVVLRKWRGVLETLRTRGLVTNAG